MFTKRVFSNLIETYFLQETLIGTTFALQCTVKSNNNAIGMVQNLNCVKCTYYKFNDRLKLAWTVGHYRVWPGTSQGSGFQL